jgi:hypothetical protein
MGDMERTITGEFPLPLCPNAGCARAFHDIERRLDVVEKDDTQAEMWKVLRKIEQDLEHMKGRLVGYQFAGALLGAIVGAMAAALVALALK